jgi:hypothetical protein
MRGQYTACEQCGKDVYCPPGKMRRWCSLACRSAALTVTRDCVTCGKSFTFPLAEAARRVTCSRECARLHRLAQRAEGRCGHCGAAFATQVSKQSRIVYCSPACRKAAQRERARHTPGYYHTYDEAGRQHQEHRLIMERIVGRPLRPNEDVHHKDEDKKNNDPSNLEILTRREHARLHHGLNGRWSLRFDCCQHCHSTERKHQSKGLCSYCYFHLRNTG